MVVGITMLEGLLSPLLPLNDFGLGHVTCCGQRDADGPVTGTPEEKTHV